uniref:Uncharacterized protein n=1 Tax=Solanum lycopersicum TaxID=4081 RepID=A0A3Q7H1T8_SOLLC
MNVETMNDNISNKLDSNTSPIRDMHVHTTSIYCFETIHDQFLLKCDVHITFKHYPQWLILNYSMTECSRSGIYWIIITRVSNNIKPARRESYTPRSEFASEYIYLPSRPPIALRPKPIEQSAKRLRLRCQLRSHRQQSSIGFPVLHEK